MHERKEKEMKVRMRNSKDVNAVCCSCGESKDNVLDMFDLQVGESVLTVCDECNEALLMKCLKAECMKNERVKSARDMAIIRKRVERERGKRKGYN